MEIVAQHFTDNIFYRGTNFAGHQFVLGLAAEFRLRYFDRQHTAQAFTHIVTGDFYLSFFGKVMLFYVFVDHPRHSGSQAGQMCTAVALWNIIGKTKHALVIPVVPLHGDFNTYVCTGNTAIAFSRPFAFGIKSIWVQNFFSGINELDKAFDAAGT